MHVCQRYKFYVWHATDIHMHRYTNTCTHICRDTSTYRYRHMHTDIHKYTCRHTQTHIHIFYIHKHTYIIGQFCQLILYLVLYLVSKWAQVPMDLFLLTIMYITEILLCSTKGNLIGKLPKHKGKFDEVQWYILFCSQPSSFPEKELRCCLHCKNFSNKG